MFESPFFHSGLYTWLVLPLMIFAARVADVSLQTLRVVFISRGMRKLAPLIGFFEVLIWILVIGQIMQNLQNILCYVAYAAGFATGTYVGITLERMINIGAVIIRVITKMDASSLVNHLREKQFGVTNIEAEGATGSVNVVFTIIPRHNLHGVVSAIREFNPNAFYSVEDIRAVSEGVFPLHPAGNQSFLKNLLWNFRKGK